MGEHPSAAVPGTAGRHPGAGPWPVYWIKTLPASGGLVGVVLGVFCLWIGARRVYRALFEFEAYRWMTHRLAKLAIATWVVMAMVKLVWFIQGSL